MLDIKKYRTIPMLIQYFRGSYGRVEMGPMMACIMLTVLPILKPTLISVAILQAMWVWHDYLLPTLVLDIRKYRTIPMLIQYFRGSYGRVEMGPMMACILLTILPIIVFYLACQKYIIEGVVAGAVKG